jgi:hypothetical protein
LTIFMLLAAAACSDSRPAGGVDGGLPGPDGSAGGDGGATLRDGGGGTGDGGTGIGDGGTGIGDGGTGVGDGGCGLVTCASLGAECGLIGDGCGLTLDCGSCPPPKTCGGGGVRFHCGTTCIPRTCTAVGANCGPVSDGCGGLIDGGCGTCGPGQSCGTGGPNVCGPAAAGDGGITTDGGCTRLTCVTAGICGSTGDGCGGSITCADCTSPQTCGGGGVANTCGTPPPCTPRTCAQANANCGPVGDGCGGLIDGGCGTCTTPDICGGAGVPSQCGNVPPGGGGCNNLCLQQVQCDAGTTTVTGTVVAPGHPNGSGWTGSDGGPWVPDPIYNALVYVPNGNVQPFTPGVSCDRCGASVSGAPLVTARTATDGTFTLTNVPCGDNIPLVIQLGRWRRQIKIPHVTCCQNIALTTEQTRLPRNNTEGDIPLMAMVTGDVDLLECVLRKIGIDESEFSVPARQGGSGRVRFYVANGADVNNPMGATTPNESQLWADGGDLNQYDMVLFACEGHRYNEMAADQQRVINYANAGGRVFATHFSYVWLTNAPDGGPVPFSQTAAWQPDQGNTDSVTGIVDQSFPKGVAFAQWLQLTGASTVPGQITVNVVRHDFNAVNAPAQRWLYVSDGGPHPLHYTFNTPIAYPPDPPVPADQQCGRVLFSDFHVSDFMGAGALTFPNECSMGPMTPQEQTLEFMLFDLASCIQPDIPVCTPKSCADQGFNCGQQGDGCGHLIDGGCGTCATPLACGSGELPGVCGTGCRPLTCQDLGYNCGQQGDGCGHLIDGGCGSCTPPETCGGGGSAGRCGSGGVGCPLLTCTAQNIACGPAGDGCGGLIDGGCGTCTPPQTCGGAGVSGQCGTPCVPQTCADVGAHCGTIGDGCGRSVDCGTCPPNQICGGPGRPNVCVPG